MTRDEVIRMAQNFGLLTGTGYVVFMNKDDELTAFANALIDAEREACAKVCEQYALNLANFSHHDHPDARTTATDCAEIIRARSNTP